jgi:hypothetical protein
VILSQLKVCNTSTCSTKARKSGKAGVPSRELVTVSQDCKYYDATDACITVYVLCLKI